MQTSNQIALVLAVSMSSLGLQSVGATTCGSGQCPLESSVDPTGGLILLQVSQDVDHIVKSTDHQHHQRPGKTEQHKMKSHKKTYQLLQTGSHQHAPTGLLSIKSEPRDDAAVSGTLKKGAIFRASSEHKAPDGKVWLHLSDGRGWVPRDQVAELEDVHEEHKKHKGHKGHKNHKSYEGPLAEIQHKPALKATTSEDHKIHRSHGEHWGHAAHGSQIAEIQQEPSPKAADSKHHKDRKGHGGHWAHKDQVSEIQQESAATSKAKEPKRTQEQIREEYKKLPMKEKGLDDHLEHEHGKTINADWRNEYPYKHDATPKKVWFGNAAQQTLSFVIGLSIVAALFA